MYKIQYFSEFLQEAMPEGGGAGNEDIAQALSAMDYRGWQLVSIDWQNGRPNVLVFRRNK